MKILYNPLYDGAVVAVGVCFVHTGYAQKKSTSRDSRMDGYIRGHDVPVALLFYHALCVEYHHACKIPSPC